MSRSQHQQELEELMDQFSTLATVDSDNRRRRVQCGNLTANKNGCHKDGPLRCSECHLIGYCSKECAKENWRSHKVRESISKGHEHGGGDEDRIFPLDRLQKLPSCFRLEA